jgi:histone acetyltransferase (RNA polymerase elongator complex component)
LGKQLLSKAERIATRAGFAQMAVIAAVGTREYYSARGYTQKGTYMLKSLA